MKYVRSKAASQNLIKDSSGRIICKKPCRIIFPNRFIEAKIANIGVNTYCYGLFAVVLENGEYDVFNLMAFIELTPYRYGKVNFGEDEYEELFFEAGSQVFRTSHLVMKDTLAWNAVNEFIFNAKVPWYVSPDDLARIYRNSRKYAGSSVGDVPETMEMLVAIITRNAKNRMVQTRTTAESLKDFEVDNVDFVPLKSVFEAVPTAVDKLTGSYLSDGIVSALTKRNTKAGKIEEILRK